MLFTRAVPLTLVVLLPALAGCGAAITNASRSAATGALGAAQERVPALAASAAASAASAARDQVLGAVTDEDVRTLVATADAQFTEDAETLVKQLAATLQTRVRETVTSTLRLSIDEALGARSQAEVDALRERLVGAPLQQDVNALIDAAQPHLAKALQAAVMPLATQLSAQVTTDLHTALVDANKLKADADAAAAHWKPIAIALAISVVAFAAALGFAVMLVRKHTRTIQVLSKHLHQQG